MDTGTATARVLVRGGDVRGGSASKNLAHHRLRPPSIKTKTIIACATKLVTGKTYDQPVVSDAVRVHRRIGLGEEHQRFYILT